jgi:hypothetical protein
MRKVCAVFCSVWNCDCLLMPQPFLSSYDHWRNQCLQGDKRHVCLKCANMWSQLPFKFLRVFCPIECEFDFSDLIDNHLLLRFAPGNKRLPTKVR